MLRAVCAALALTVPGTAPAGEDTTAIAPGKSDSPATSFHLDALSLNVYGLSYHPDREKAHRTHLDNEINPGLGLHYELENREWGLTFAEVGSYRDSGSNWVKYAGLGYQYKVGAGWRLGGAIAAIKSRTYNEGAAFLGVVPLVTYDFGPVQLNAVYFPKLSEYNVESAFGVYITLPVGKWAQ